MTETFEENLPDCDGSGEVLVHSGHHPNDPACVVEHYECPGCDSCKAPASRANHDTEKNHG
jgi:hypothetical protein